MKTKKIYLIVIGIFLLIGILEGMSAAIYNMTDYSTRGHKAYEKGGASSPTNPFNYDAEAVSGDYANLNSDNDVYWDTSLVSTDSYYDSQIFHFNISENPSALNSLNLSWKGKSGEQGYAGYDLTAYIWKASTSSWEQINTDSDGSTTEVSWTLNITSSPSNYVNSTSSGKWVYIMVRFKKRVACAASCCTAGCYSGSQAGYCASGSCCSECLCTGTCCIVGCVGGTAPGTCSDPVTYPYCCDGSGCTPSSCPYIYSWNGTDYVFDAEAITAFGTIKETEAKQPSKLQNLKSENGIFKLKITEELKETSYLDSIELLKVSHPKDVEIYSGLKLEAIQGYPQILGIDVPVFILQYYKNHMERNLEKEKYLTDVSSVFKIYTLKNQIKPLNVTEKGKEVKELFEIDDKFWNEDFSMLDMTDANDDLVLDIENLSEVYRSAEFIYPRGESDSAKLRIHIKQTERMSLMSTIVYQNAKKLGIYDGRKMMKYGIRESSYRISIWDGKEWVNKVYVNDYPREKSASLVVPLNLTNIHTDNLKVKVEAAHGVLLLDGAYIDYSEDVPVTIERLPLIKAEKGKENIVATLSDSDNKRISMIKGDEINLEFKGEGDNASFFLNARGYYIGDEIPNFPEVSNKKIFERLYSEEGFSPRYWTLRYKNFEEGTSSLKKVEENFKRLNVPSSIYSADLLELKNKINTIYTDYVDVSTSEYSPPYTFFSSPTPDNGTTTSNTSIGINVSIYGAPPLDTIIYNWNGTNYSFLNSNLVLSYNLNNLSALGETQTSIFDISGRGHTGTANGNAVPTSSGKYNGGFLLDGSGDYISTPDSDDFAFGTGNFSVSLWIKFNKVPQVVDGSASDAAGIWGQRVDSTHYNLFHIWAWNNSGIIRHAFGFHTVDGASDIQWLSHTYRRNGVYASFETGQWYHFYIMRGWNGDPNEFMVYVDGTMAILDNINNNSNSLPNIAAPFHMGVTYTDGGTGHYLNGTIDDYRVIKGGIVENLVLPSYMSSLAKYNSSAWGFYINQSKNATAGLDDGTYTYQAYASGSGLSNSTGQRTIYISQQCSPITNADWIITNAQTCNAKTVNIGTGKIIVGSGGNLSLVGSSNVTSSGVEILRIGDSIFVYSGSKLYVY